MGTNESLFVNHQKEVSFFTVYLIRKKELFLSHTNYALKWTLQPLQSNYVVGITPILDVFVLCKIVLVYNVSSSFLLFAPNFSVPLFLFNLFCSTILVIKLSGFWYLLGCAVSMERDKC